MVLNAWDVRMRFGTPENTKTIFQIVFGNRLVKSPEVADILKIRQKKLHTIYSVLVFVYEISAFHVGVECAHGGTETTTC